MNYKTGYLKYFEDFIPRKVAKLWEFEVNYAAKKSNYRRFEEYLNLLKNTPDSKDIYNNCVSELIKKYPRRTKLQEICRKLKNSNYDT